jgi:hypothetical protein
MKKDTVEVPLDALVLVTQNNELSFAGSEAHNAVLEAVAVLQQAAGIKSLWDTSTGGSNFRNH